MRIYFGAYWFLPASVGFINGLAKRHSLFVVTTEGAAREVGMHWREVLAPNTSVRCETRIKLKNPLYWWQRAVGVWRGVKWFGCDLIHVQEVPDPFLDWLLLRLKRIPLVLTVHDPVPHLGEKGFMKYYRQRRPWMEAVRRRADQIVVHGEETRRQLARVHPELPSERLAVIPHGPRDFYLRWKGANEVTDPRTVLFFGRINAYKGLGTLLDAWEKVTAVCPEAKLMIAGRGYDLPSYRERILRDPQCELLDRFIPSEEVASLFARAGVVVLPYLEATQSGVLATALAFGKPAVVTNVGSLPEMVEHGKSGFVVPPGDVDALAEALLRLLQDMSLQQQMSENTQRLATTRFGWEQLVARLEEVYHRAIQHHPKQH